MVFGVKRSKRSGFFVFLYLASSFSLSALNVLVEPFEVVSEYDGSSWVSIAIQSELEACISKNGDYKVITNKSRALALDEMAVQLSDVSAGPSVAMNFTGAEKVLTGVITINKTGDFILRAEYTDIASGTCAVISSQDTVADYSATIMKILDDFFHISIVVPKRENRQSVYKLYGEAFSILQKNENQALVKFEELIRIDPSFIDAYLQLAIIASNKRDYAKALTYVSLAENLIAGNDINSQKHASIYEVKSIVLTNKGDYPSSLEYSNKAKAIYELLNLAQTAGYSQLLANIGYCYVKNVDYGNGLSYYNAAKTLLEKIGQNNTAMYLNVIFNIASLAGIVGDNVQAAKLLDSLKTVYEDNNATDNLQYLNAIMELYAAYAKIDTPKAVSLQGKIEETLKKTNNEASDYQVRYLMEKGLVYYNIGSVSRQNNDFVTALLCYQSALQLLQKNNQKLSENYALVLVRCSNIFVVYSQFDNAITQLNEAKTICEILNITRNENYSTILMNLGVLYYNKKDLNTAKTYLMSAKTNLEKNNMTGSVAYKNVVKNIGTFGF